MVGRSRQKRRCQVFNNGRVHPQRQLGMSVCLENPQRRRRGEGNLRRLCYLNICADDYRVYPSGREDAEALEAIVRSLARSAKRAIEDKDAEIQQLTAEVRFLTDELMKVNQLAPGPTQTQTLRSCSPGFSIDSS